ncbi:hypothetical protein M231_01945 [Tremella mesenterica]|uniref:Glycogenin glucosyltransferase n=1 Tax=Tremella mesenterica TaxID=5217 RepID=A0A4Q1BRU4_TREME|nr:hypothetical protein M231_01945 [Tremella mesenterica]
MLPNAFITLLTTPSYLPGALVILHSLRELHPDPRQFKIVCLVTPETVDARVIGQLREAGFDLIIGVEPIASGEQGQDGLNLMGRPDLNLALTKLHLFRLAPLFSTIIYLDADVLPIRPLDHLFTATEPHVLSACPDTGWPDCFNSGVMVIRPRESDFLGMQNLLKGGEGSDGVYRAGNGSFDGADQGVLNEWFSEEGGGGDWHRLPFTYNVTPTAAYQYTPAYKRYGHKINAVHFIGPHKPWSNLSTRPARFSTTQNKPQAFDYPSLIDRWYGVYDRNVRPAQAHQPDIVKRFAVPENVAVWNQPTLSGTPHQPDDRMDLEELKAAAERGVNAFSSGQYTSLPLEGRVNLMMPKPQPALIPPPLPPQPPSPTISATPHTISVPLPQTIQQQTQQPATWDATHHAPPSHGRPEMEIHMNTHYEPAWEQPASVQSSYFQQPPVYQPEPHYPSIPPNVRNDQWYREFTGTVPSRSLILPVFPWEEPGHHHHRAERVFPPGNTPPPESPHLIKPFIAVQEPTPPVQSPSRSPEHVPAPAPAPPPRSMEEAMASYINAWDVDPKIQRYVDRISGSRRGTSTPSALQSVPGTPRYVPVSYDFDHQQGMDSDGSEDGDDEGGDDESSESLNSSRATSRERPIGDNPISSSNSRKRYRDRYAQTDNPQLADAKVQVVPGGGPSPALRVIDLPPTHPQPRNVSVKPTNNAHIQSQSEPTEIPSRKTSSSSDTARPETALVTPTSDAVALGGSTPVPFPVSHEAPKVRPRIAVHRQTPSTASIASEHLTDSGVPKNPQSVARVWDPSTDPEVMKRETQEMLDRFMRLGSFTKTAVIPK